MENILDFRVICCTCLNVTHSTISVYHRDLKYNVLLVEMINKISHIELKPTDEYPNKLCYTCADKLRIAYEFRMMCDDSNNILLSHRKHSKELAPAHPEAEHLVHDESLLLAKTRIDFIEYDGVEEYLEEYLLETAEIVPSNEEQNTEQHTNISVAEKDIIPPEFDEKEEYLLSGDNPKSDTKPTIIADAEAAEVTEIKCPICGKILSKMAHLRRHLKLHNRTKSFRCTQCPTVFSRWDQISPIELKPTDEYPDKLCYTCADKLRIAYEFRLMCDDSNNILLSQRKQSTESAPAHPEAKHLAHDESLLLAETSNDFIEYDGVEEYLEEYLLETEETVPSNEEQNTEQHTNISVAEKDIIPPEFDEKEEYLLCNDSPKSDTKSTIIDDAEAAEVTENKCPICGQILSKMAHLRRHLKLHNRTKSFRCTQCPKVFSRSDNLRAHEKNHSQERHYKCPQCDQRFKRMDALKVHMSVRHKQYVEAHFHVCSYCNTFFETEQKLNAHLAKRRSEKKFVCHICGKTFAELLRYEIHLEKHANAGSNVETFECFHCSKLFDSKKRLSLHIRYHTSDKVYKCKYCDESFARKTELKYHEDYHTGTKNHVCKTCGQSFYRLNALKTHMMTHTDEKPFQCSHCPKRFRQKYDMITHERRHTGERFQCDMCTEKFIHAHQLNSHLKIVHDLNVKCRKRGVTKFFPASDKHTEDRPENDAKSSSSRNEN